ncbi:uncharacterized protein LOC128802801 isoform X2 [Vidua macroura]|uniref:uncharacterized protein LOC128802801 isoform X2 n=1 Tax=Vidua macroura TaxID=187451 RepID=UPI0023A83429|nr:uncharacterized protein LOC128802801 isoform X2 [Vidua macroura]
MGELLREGPGLPVGAALPFPGLLWDLVPPAPWAAPGWGRTPLEPTLLQQGPPGMRLEGAWEPLPARGRRNGNIWNCLEQLQLHFVSRWSQKVTLAFVERPRTRGRPPPPRPTRFPDKPTALFQAGFGAEGSATSGADKAAAPGQRHPHPPPQKKKIQPRWGDGESRAGVPSVQTTCSGGKGCTVVCTLVTPARAAPEPELPQESDSAVSTNQYSLEPPFMMLMLLMVSQPLRITCSTPGGGRGGTSAGSRSHPKARQASPVPQGSWEQCCGNARSVPSSPKPRGKSRELLPGPAG